MSPDEKGVLDSLENGSLAWFANKCRYEYFKALEKGFAIGDSEKMKILTDQTFNDSSKVRR